MSTSTDRIRTIELYGTPGVKLATRLSENDPDRLYVRTVTTTRGDAGETIESFKGDAVTIGWVLRRDNGRRWAAYVDSYAAWRAVSCADATGFQIAETKTQTEAIAEIAWRVWNRGRRWLLEADEIVEVKA